MLDESSARNSVHSLPLERRWKGEPGSRREVIARERLGEGRVRASIAYSHLAWVEEYGGPAEWTFLLSRGESLFPLLNHELEGEEWIEFEKLIRLDRLICSIFGEGLSHLELLSDLGRFSARQHLKTISPEWNSETLHSFFREVAWVHRHLQNFGTIEYEELGARSLAMQHLDYRSFSPTFCATAIGYYEQCLLQHGGIRPIVFETNCVCFGDTSCRFEMRWK